MNLFEALSQAKSISDFNLILANKVSVQLGLKNEEVSIYGYEGMVEADFIAHCIVNVIKSETEDSKKLANLLAEKVFVPLKNLVEAKEAQESASQIAALAPGAFKLPNAPEFGQSLTYKHILVLGLLDRRYAFWH